MTTRFKVDENLPREAAALIREAGHEVQSALGEGLGGRPDAQILEACRSEDRVLITLDLDFADIQACPPAGYAGIWVLRPITQSIESTVTLLRGALALLEKESTKNRLWIVEHDRVRIRE